jgi:flavin reductase (DIM6/NTAB) family NADH-FMN oxidoreductase RutF
MTKRDYIREVDAMEHIAQIINGVKKGVLLTTKLQDKVNSMTISWGHIGFEWNKLIFIAYVRTGRHTHKILNESKEFTINIGTDDTTGHILSYCGTKSGADTDKIHDLGLTLISGNKISTPGIKELPLTLECKVIFQQLQDEKAFSKELLERFYPSNVPTSYSGSNRDFHTMYYGEVLGAYMVL